MPQEARGCAPMAAGPDPSRLREKVEAKVSPGATEGENHAEGI
jgi:hypothetical protein